MNACLLLESTDVFVQLTSVPLGTQVQQDGNSDQQKRKWILKIWSMEASNGDKLVDALR